MRANRLARLGRERCSFQLWSAVGIGAVLLCLHAAALEAATPIVEVGRGATAAVGAVGLAGQPCQSGCCLPVRVVMASPHPRSFVDRVLDVVDRIWEPYGVAFAWSVEQFRRGQPAQLRVILDDTSSQPNAPAGRRVLAWIPFLAPEQPHTAIRVSVPEAERFLDESFHVLRWHPGRAIQQRRTLLVRAVGRGVAHEIGHYLMASPGHARQGLMIATFGLSHVEQPEPSAATLDGDEVARLWRPGSVLSACRLPAADDALAVDSDTSQKELSG